MSRVPSSQVGYQGNSYVAQNPSSYVGRPQAAWAAGARPMVHPYVPTTSSRTQQQQIQQQQNLQQQQKQQQQQQQQQQHTGIAPHLHPAYSGRGRPPLSLGRRIPSNTTQTSKRNLSQQQSTHGSSGTATGATSTAVAQAAAAAALQPRSRKPVDGKETSYLTAGTTNRLLLSLRSGLPSHVTWALSRLAHASCHHLEALALDTFPGMTDGLLRFPRRLISAISGEEVEKWEPTFWEQEERQVDCLGKGSWQEAAEVDETSDEDDDLEETKEPRKGLKESLSFVRNIPAVFSPGEIPSHKRLLEHAVAAMLVLRNLSLNERNERIFLAYSKTINTLICDILALSNAHSTRHISKEWSEMQGIEEMKIYALDILEVTRIRLHIRKRSSMTFDAKGMPISFPVYSEPVEQETATSTTSVTGTKSVEDEMIRAAKRAAAGTSDYLFNLLVWHLHMSSDRSILMGCLRCLGALAAEERNESAFIEADVSLGLMSRQNGARRLTGLNSTATVSSPGILKKCLMFLPLTQDSALLEAALDCLYQVINIGDNALRLATCVNDGVAPLGIGIGRLECGTEDEAEERGIGDVRTIIRLLSRNLIYGRVVWDRTHQLTLHPALHGHVPSAVAARRKERDELYRKRRLAEGDEKERSKLRRLQRKEWLELKGMPEPDRLKAWMKLIYEAKEGGEVTQMEFWSTYSNQFGPFASLGGPALQPAAEVIRTVSSVFPGAIAMVIQNSKFVVRGVEARDRSFMRRFECKWKGCHAPETDSWEAVEGHVQTHTSMANDGKCHWLNCTYSVPNDVESGSWSDTLRLHTLTHLPETDEAIESREAKERQKHREEDLMLTKSLKSQDIKPAVMANGARYLSGPTALMPNSNFASEKRRIETERQENKRRKMLNTPVRGTVDLPDLLAFAVTRTPMDPETSKPTGISSTSGLILRSLARTTATILIKAGVREKRKVERNQGGFSGGNEKFGLPLPPSGTEVDAKAPLPEGDVHENNGVGTGGIGPVEDWALQAASRIMDAILDVEEQLMTVASENDILCPMLNETLIELKPEPGESIWREPEASEEEEVDL